MHILSRNDKGNVLSFNDEDDAFEDTGVMVVVLSGEEFIALIHRLPRNEAQELLDKCYEANFGHCKSCDSLNWYHSNKNLVTCTECGKPVQLTSMADHLQACWEAEQKHNVWMAKNHQKLGG